MESPFYAVAADEHCWVGAASATRQRDMLSSEDALGSLSLSPRPSTASLQKGENWRKKHLTLASFKRRHREEEEKLWYLGDIRRLQAEEELLYWW